MILVFDVGNTNIEIGIFHKEFGNEKVVATARRFTRREESFDELAFFILRFLEINKVKTDSIEKIVFSSVVPQLNFCFHNLAAKYFPKSKVIEVSSSINLGINNKYKNPGEVGADRLVNAAYVFYKYKCNSIIVDMGTATTFCVILQNGDYLGGVIMPGIYTSSQALFQKAAKLQSVDICKQEKIMGNSTAEAIESGIYFSNLYAIEGIIKGIKKELKMDECFIVGTGGYASLFADDLFDVFDNELAMKALKYIADIN